MKDWKLLMLLAACALMASCAHTRSISNSGYHDPEAGRQFAPRDSSDPGFAYRGELSEFEVLGVARDRHAFEEDIQQALENARPVKLKSDATLLLIQSGAMFPDSGMVTNLSRHFTVVPFSGVPNQRMAGTDNNDTDYSFSKSLRLAAARGGAETILCYWGILESAQEHIATKTVTWVPVVGWFVPDERQHMRIRLKLALIDVRTGNWSVLSPPAFDSKATSWSPRRDVADQKLVERLKEKAYATAVENLVNQYGDVAAAQ
jgi:hypothetical protein